MLIRLIYNSLPAVRFSREDVFHLVRHARERNERDGITGVLIYDSVRFLQYLEGDDSVVDACFDRIKADLRHREIDVITRQETHERAFKSWKMGSVVYEDAP